MLIHAVATSASRAGQTSRKILLVAGTPGDASSWAAMLEGVAFEVVAADSFLGSASLPDSDRFDLVVVAPGATDPHDTALVDAVKDRVPAAPVFVVSAIGNSAGPSARAADGLVPARRLQRTLLLQCAANAIECRRAAAVLRETEEGHRQLVQISGEAIVVHAAGGFVLVNDAAAELLGAASPADLIGEPIGGYVAEKDREKVTSSQPDAAGGVEQALPLRLIRVDRTVVDTDGATAACRYDGQPAIQMTLNNVGKHRPTEPSVHHPLQYDPLTELPNRSLFRDRLVGAMARARRDDLPVGLILVDLDGFHSINRRFGLEVGDLALREVAQRLNDSIRPGETVARVGGVTFAAILEGMAEADEAAIVARRALASLSMPIVVDGSEIRLTASAGIAWSSARAESLDGLLRKADIAMYHARKQGRNNCQVHSPELDAQIHREELKTAEVARRAASLTPREREVMGLLVAGKPNKMVAFLLGTHTRTIENHRARIMEKMQAESLPELVRMALANG